MTCPTCERPEDLLWDCPTCSPDLPPGGPPAFYVELAPIDPPTQED